MEKKKLNLSVKIKEEKNCRTLVKQLLFVVSFSFMSIMISCSGSEEIASDHKTTRAERDSLYSQLTEEQKRLPENATMGLEVADGLEVQLFASEPDITNPTNIDVDHKGRVWVCEAYNYRPSITGHDTRPKGDRIVILEDSNGDGKSDKTTVFYQGPELNAPLGIWVMGNKAIVSQSPYVWLFTDTDGDDKADKKEIIFQGIAGEQHDHGMHAFVFGPDGKFYFNFGNAGEQIQDANGETVRDKSGKAISQNNFKQGMVFRSNADFSNVEVLADNFRNNYEVAVDSYGTMWQSDNDDDGNKGTRINYVMEYGNYGYTDEMTGAGWQANRTNMEKEIPLRHWHLNDPGVIPNLLQTGAGSPTGMVVYEGRLLPEIYWDQMIHADAGPNVIRSYPVKKDGAGYKASINVMLEGVRDQWFRPSDLCVAPDGSLMVADWYDPGVGGHQAGDLNRGRIYRIAPPNTPYKSSKLDVSTVEGAIEALQSPNLSARYLAWQSLHQKGAQAEKELLALYKNSDNPRMKARALWLLTKIEGKGKEYVGMAMESEDPNLRITGLRAARQLNMNILPLVRKLVDDKEVQVLRECALALRYNTAPEAAELWAALAQKYDGNDRWYLEALGIGADKQWNRFYTTWLANAGNNPLANKGNRDIIWRARTGKSVPLLAELATEQAVALEDRLRYFRAFDFNPDGAAKSAALVNMLVKDSPEQAQINELVLRHLDPDYIKRSPVATKVLKEVLNKLEGKPEFVEMVAKYEVKEENPRLLALALAEKESGLGREAARILLQQEGENLVRKTLQNKDEQQVMNMLQALRGVGSKTSLLLIEEVAFDKTAADAVRREAARSIGGSWDGEARVLELLKANKIPEELKASAVSGVSNAWRKSVRMEAASYLSNGSEASSQSVHPPLKDLLSLEGHAENGILVFERNCQLCHQVKGKGNDFGPKLSEIGDKLPKEALYISIIHPNAGISFGYEGYIIKMKDGSTNVGIIASKTETDIDLKVPGGNKVKLKLSEVVSMDKMEDSMMPTGLENALTTDELVDLVEYLQQLKKES